MIFGTESKILILPFLQKVLFVFYFNYCDSLSIWDLQTEFSCYCLPYTISYSGPYIYHFFAHITYYWNAVTVYLSFNFRKWKPKDFEPEIILVTYIHNPLYHTP